jgi:hypothetical protein
MTSTHEIKIFSFNPKTHYQPILSREYERGGKKEEEELRGRGEGGDRADFF